MKYAEAKTTHLDFPYGRRFGFAAAILTPAQYLQKHNAACIVGEELDDAWVFDAPEKLSPTDPAIDGATTDAERREWTANWNEQISEFDRFDAHEIVFKDKLYEAYDLSYWVTIRCDLLGFSAVSVYEMLDHLLSQCLALTDTEKEAMLEEAKIPWNQDMQLETFFQQLDKNQLKLAEDGVEWTNGQKITHAMAQLYASNVYDERDMRVWEQKDPTIKTWTHLQKYFNDIYIALQRFSKAGGGRHGFESAANMEEKQREAERETEREAERDAYLSAQLNAVSEAATADKEHIQQMSNFSDEMLAIVKDQQATIKSLQRQNEELVKQMGRLTDKLGSKTDTGGGGTARSNARTDSQKAAGLVLKKAIEAGTKPHTTSGNCDVCGRHGGGTKACLEFEENKEKRKDWWKSIFA